MPELLQAALLAATALTSAVWIGMARRGYGEPDQPALFCALLAFSLAAGTGACAVARLAFGLDTLEAERWLRQATLSLGLPLVGVVALTLGRRWIWMSTDLGAHRHRPLRLFRIGAPIRLERTLRTCAGPDQCIAGCLCRPVAVARTPASQRWRGWRCTDVGSAALERTRNRAQPAQCLRATLAGAGLPTHRLVAAQFAGESSRRNSRARIIARRAPSKPL